MKIRRILAPIDFSDFSAAGLQQAADLAKTFGAELLVLYVVSTQQASAMAWAPGNPWEKVVEDFGKDIQAFLEEQVPPEVLSAIQVHSLVSAGAPVMEIVRTAVEEEADLIVLATHGRTGLKHTLLGSVTENVVRLSRKPVWTVRREALAFEKP